MRRIAMGFGWIFLSGLIFAPVLLSQNQSDEDLKKAVNGGLEDAKNNPLKEKAAQRARLEAALRETVECMRDFYEMWGTDRDYFDHPENAPVTLRTQDVPCAVEIDTAGAASIYMSDALPPFPRVLGPYLVKAIAHKAFSALPDSAEKEYMEISLQARAWQILRGDKKSLPVIEELVGYRDKALSDRFALWMDRDSDQALKAAADATGRKTIAALLVDVEGELKDSKTPEKRRQELALSKKRLEDARQNFEEVLTRESWWRDIQRSEKLRWPAIPGQWNDSLPGPASSYHLVESTEDLKNLWKQKLDVKKEVLSTVEDWEAFWKTKKQIAPPADLSKYFAVAISVEDCPQDGYDGIKFSNPEPGAGATIIRFSIAHHDLTGLGPIPAGRPDLFKPFAVKLFPKTQGKIEVQPQTE